MIKRSKAKPAVDPPAQSLFELIEHSDWLIPAKPGRPGLFRWRTMLALAFREVPIRPLEAQLWPVFLRMADQVSERLTFAVAEGAVSTPGFADWLELWREQFNHWHDPVRTLVCQYVPRDEVARLTGQLALLDGFSFADFVLHAVIEFEQREHLGLLLAGKIPSPRLMPYAIYGVLYSDAPAMGSACTYLYARFQYYAAFRTLPAPARPISWADVANIYAEPMGRASDIDHRQEENL
jgi:hypothetical protein